MRSSGRRSRWEEVVIDEMGSGENMQDGEN